MSRYYNARLRGSARTGAQRSMSEIVFVSALEFYLGRAECTQRKRGQRVIASLTAGHRTERLDTRVECGEGATVQSRVDLRTRFLHPTARPDGLR